MMLTRRGFLGAALATTALTALPGAVRAASAPASIPMWRISGTDGYGNAIEELIPMETGGEVGVGTVQFRTISTIVSYWPIPADLP